MGSTPVLSTNIVTTLVSAHTLVVRVAGTGHDLGVEMAVKCSYSNCDKEVYIKKLDKFLCYGHHMWEQPGRKRMIDSRRVKCDSCDWYGIQNELDSMIKHLEQRIEAGGEVPAGQCPECGSLAYFAKKMTKRAKKEGHYAWAVRVTYREKYREDNERPFLAGRYYFQQHHTHKPACEIALFSTRKEARKIVKAQDSTVARFKAVKVRVTVKEVKD